MSGVAPGGYIFSTREQWRACLVAHAEPGDGIRPLAPFMTRATPDFPSAGATAPVATREGDGVTRELVGVDQGTGAADRPVVGFSFWVRADDVGVAAFGERLEQHGLPRAEAAWDRGLSAARYRKHAVENALTGHQRLDRPKPGSDRTW